MIGELTELTGEAIELTGEAICDVTGEVTGGAIVLEPDCAFAVEANASAPPMHESNAKLSFDFPIFNSPSLVWV